MARILNRKQSVFELKEMLFNAEKYVYLICPYINLLNDEYITRGINHAHKKGVDITIIYSKGHSSSKKGRPELEQFHKYDNIKLCYINDSHMKVYISDKAAIVGSLNLHEFSMKNNLECGVWIDAKEDLWKDLYSMVKKDVYKNMVVEKKRGKQAISEAV